MSAIPTARQLAVVIFLAAAATLAGALYFEHVVGLAPCPLCLQQRIPYYVGIPVAGLAALVPPVSPARPLRLGIFAGLALIFGASAIFGAYHAGVEWDWWEGPSACATVAGDMPASIADLQRALAEETVIRCDEAPWRLFGISLAGYNALISLGLTGLALLAVQKTRLQQRIA